MIDLFINPGNHQLAALTALAEGISSPVKLLRVENARKTDTPVCVCWGVRFLEKLKAIYEHVIVLEMGYFNDRLTYYSLGMNGLNGRAHFNNNNSNPARWIDKGKVFAPWKNDGEYYVIMGQVDGDMSIQGVNINQWYKKMFSELSLLTDKPIYFRPHPLSRPTSDLEKIGGDLKEVLSRAAGVVTYNSNSGVDAVLAGVPTMTQDPGSMAWPVSAKTLSQLMAFSFPDRNQWAYNLAYTQWDINELRNGSAWNHLCKLL